MTGQSRVPRDPLVRSRRTRAAQSGRADAQARPGQRQAGRRERRPAGGRLHAVSALVRSDLSDLIVGAEDDRVDRRQEPNGRTDAPGVPAERKAYSVAEAGRLLGVHGQTVRALIDAGRLHAVRLGRRVVIPLWALDAVLEAPAQGGGDVGGRGRAAR